MTGEGQAGGREMGEKEPAYSIMAGEGREVTEPRRESTADRKGNTKGQRV